MRALSSLTLAALLLAPAAVSAQGSPVAEAARQMARENARNLLEAARLMPADKYDFKPTPAQMSFGQLIAHIAGDNHLTCSSIAGTKPEPRARVTAADGKEKLVTALERSLDECTAALKGLQESTLGDTVTWYGGKTTRAMTVIGLLTDWADHYSQQAIYLRLNGILPPTARRSGM